jgi:Zn finger protein HypA/HybF involved in hydrogenase expression
MGWNDHVVYCEMRCAQCGAVSDWEFWDRAGRERYIGSVGKLVGQDATRHGKCPKCGSNKGEATPGDDDEYGD